MSGPVILTYSGGVLGGMSITTVMIDGIGGTAAIYPGDIVDEYIPDAYMDGKLRLKEKVCHDDMTPYERKPFAARSPRPNSTRVSR